LLKHTASQRGLTLIELAVALTITAILLGAGVPSFVSWIRNTHIRTTAEAFQNGIQLARAEAVRRNRPVRFQITDTLAADCIRSTTGTNWVVSLNDIDATAAKCDSTPTDPPALPAVPDAENPYIIQARPNSDGSANTLVTADQSGLIFNGLGRVTPAPTGDVTIGIVGNTGTCVADGGSVRCLRIIVSTNGQVRICDPAITLSGDPRAC
jgi:type IV fimbrial biogenesis protein FimT